ncbi:hypothetical protein KQH40_00415 [bacterium]|nr:hypothetical protein [bacterium]
MSDPTKLGKFLRVVGLILLGLTAIFHLLGGIGTSCVALGAEKYDSMSGIVPYQWAYLIFVVVTIAIGIYGIRATTRFSRNKVKSYRDAMLFLVIGLIVSTVHMFTSRALRGTSMPNDARVYMNALTLIVFVIFNIPKLRKIMAIDTNIEIESGSSGLGAALVVMGLTTLNVHIFMQNTHTWNGVNYADIWHTQLQVAGFGLMIVGLAIALASILKPDQMNTRERVRT